MTTITERKDGLFTLKRVSDSIDTIGQSIAHDGACMTVASFTDDEYTFFAMEESLLTTTLGQKKVGDICNIEFPVTIGQHLGGHLVTGHIDTMGTVSFLEVADDGSLRMGCSYSTEYDMLVVPKGSITINGVSLTVVDVFDGGCSVRLIPQTQQETTLGSLRQGDSVNIEFDIMGKYATKWGRV